MCFCQSVTEAYSQKQTNKQTNKQKNPSSCNRSLYFPKYNVIMGDETLSKPCIVLRHSDPRFKITVNSKCNLKITHFIHVYINIYKKCCWFDTLNIIWIVNVDSSWRSLVGDKLHCFRVSISTCSYYIS